jgi:CHAD domain-containing protein
METETAISAEMKQVGLDFWMGCVMQEFVHARRDFAPDQVHDLRVALRRCRFIADGFRSFDPHPAWKQMKNEGKRLFRQLGALRDIQVMIEWVQRLAPVADETSTIMNTYLVGQEKRFKANAEKALLNFNKKKWISWRRLLSERSQRIPPDSMAFRHLALERWSEMRELHRQALRNRSHVAYHRLRIGLKKFRYTIENFLPAFYASWGTELRELQDLLGEMHDLYVLWRTALAIKAIRDEVTRTDWRQRVFGEIKRRLGEYREKMLGKTSLALVWRSELPDSMGITAAAFARIRAWAMFRDPDFAHSELVARLALQIYDGLDSCALMLASNLSDARRKLEAAALLHDVGLSEARKKHHLASYRLICKMNPPLGWSAETLRHIALIARFHRGSLPRPAKKAFSDVPDEQKKSIILLCGILRLANAFDWAHEKRILRLEVKKTGDFLRVIAPGYAGDDASAERLAAARHLLEASCGLPILIQ